MNSSIKALESGTAPNARTNILKLLDNQQELIGKFLTPFEGGEVHINFGSTYMPKEKAESKEAYFKRVDSQIRTIISKAIGAESRAGIHYNRLNGNSDIKAFFYLGAAPDATQRTLDEIQRLNLDLHQVAAALLGLLLKMDYLNDASERYQIRPVEYNADLYVGVIPVTKPTKQHPEVMFDGLRPELYFSRHQELVLTLKRQVFRCSVTETAHFVTDTSSFICDFGGKRYIEKSRVDARRFKERQYMRFTLSNERRQLPANQWKDYDSCTNYHQNDVMNRLEGIFQTRGISYQRDTFQATHRIDEFLSPPTALANEVVVIDCLRYQDIEEQVLFWQYLQEKVKPARIVREEDAPAPGDLPTSGVSHLVLSQKTEAGTSIIDKATGTTYNTFWPALHKHQTEKTPPDFDYYTRTKIQRFLGNSGVVCQGYDIEAPFKINDNVGERAMVPLDENAVARIGYELWLKECVFQRKVVHLPDANFQCRRVELLSCRRDENYNRYVMVVEVEMDGSEIRILNTMRYDNDMKGRFDDRYAILRKALESEKGSSFESLYDGGFMLHDLETGIWLNAYRSGRVPVIIGNIAFDNVARHHKERSVNRSSKVVSSPLPYYLTSTINKQQHFVFLQDNGVDGVRYFVSKKDAPEMKIAKQNLINNVLLHGPDGTHIAPLGHPVTELFFSTFTYDLLRLRESAKMSVLQKIVELHLEN